jgi:hypothetical protein
MILDDPDVIKNHKNDVATFPNMLQAVEVMYRVNVEM